MKALLLLSVLISLTSPALARIGETREQCEARYGKPVKIDEEKQVIRYEKAGFKIRCEFYQGKCDDITFNHVETDEKLDPLPLSDAELKTLMESNSAGRPWTLETKDEDGYESWKCMDLVAGFNSRPVKYLFISTQAHIERGLPSNAAKR